LYFLQVHVSTHPYADHAVTHNEEVKADHEARGIWLWPRRMADNSARLLLALILCDIFVMSAVAVFYRHQKRYGMDDDQFNSMYFFGDPQSDNVVLRTGLLFPITFAPFILAALFFFHLCAPRQGESALGILIPCLRCCTKNEGRPDKSRGGSPPATVRADRQQTIADATQVVMLLISLSFYVDQYQMFKLFLPGGLDDEDSGYVTRDKSSTLHVLLSYVVLGLVGVPLIGSAYAMRAQYREDVDARTAKSGTDGGAETHYRNPLNNGDEGDGDDAE
jgi:hypothetical protein